MEGVVQEYCHMRGTPCQWPVGANWSLGRADCVLSVYQLWRVLAPFLGAAYSVSAELIPVLCPCECLWLALCVTNRPPGKGAQQPTAAAVSCLQSHLRQCCAVLCWLVTTQRV